MALVKGLDAAIWVGGTATAMTSEATTDVGGLHTTWQITDATKRAIDPMTAVVVTSSIGGILSSTLYSVDYINGIITYTAVEPLEVITVGGKYIPLLQVAKGRSLSLDADHEVADVAVFGDTSPRTLATRCSMKISLDSIESPGTDLDTGGGTRILAADLLTGVPIFIEAAPSTTLAIRGWFVPESGTIKATLADVVSTELKLKSVFRNGVAGFGLKV